jgi:type IV secretory pathway TraG/TraD family ATPase VirD4
MAQISKSEWFIASEVALNRFKHSVKSAMLFMVLPVLFFHFVASFFIIPAMYTSEYELIKNTITYSFSSDVLHFFSNGKVFSEAIFLFIKLQLKLFINGIVFYGVFVFLVFLFIKKKSGKFVERNYISGSILTRDRVDILYEYMRDYGWSWLDFIITNFYKMFLKKATFENYLKGFIQEKYDIEIAKIPLLKKYEISHVLIPGASRKGKSQILRDPIFQAKQLSKKGCARGLITDEKGEWFSKTGDLDNGDMIFNPLDKRSIKWTIFNDIENIIDITNYAKWIIPDSPGQKDPFWTNSAREIFKNCLLYCWHTDKRTNAELRKLINSGAENIHTLISKNLSSSAAEFIEKQDSYLSFKVFMSFIDYLEDGDFSIKQYLKQDSGFIYLTSNTKTKELFKPAMTLFVNVLGAEILAAPDSYDASKRFYFFLEEFTSLDRLDMIISLLKLSGSKSVSIWLAFQDFQQISKIYSKDDMASVINNCSSIACLGLNEPDAAEFFSKKFGEQKYYEKNKTHSMGVQENRDGISVAEQTKKEKVIEASDLLNLPALQAYVKLEGAKSICHVQFSINQDKTINEAFVINDKLVSNTRAVGSDIQNKETDKKNNVEELDLNFNEDDIQALEAAAERVEKESDKENQISIPLPINKNSLMEGL